jgi:APA family basic amino acid/polyamine antiporter
MKSAVAENREAEDKQTGLVRELGLLDSTMLVAGSMIGSGIFLVAGDIARHVGSPGWLLLVWIATGVLTVAGALSYAELAAMMPNAGGVYVYLREAFSPLWGFLYGWTLFLVIQAGGIAAVAVAFSVYLGELAPAISSTSWIIPPINLSASYAVSLSSQQLVAILMIVALTLINMRGLHVGKIIQNVFTSTKTLGLAGLIIICFIGLRADVIVQNLEVFWTPQNPQSVRPDLFDISAVSASSGLYGLFIAFCVAQVGSIFAADGWYYLTFTGGEVKRPSRTLPLSLIGGTVLVITLYILANLGYLATLPFTDIQTATDDRVATASLNVALGAAAATVIAVIIMISTFGANNGIILAGARVFYTMARDGLFFKRVATLNSKHVPAHALILQCLVASLLVLPRTRKYDDAGALLTDPATGAQVYGNLYSNLLDYVVFAILVFFALTVLGLFVLRRKRPHDLRPYRAWGYPVLPALYVIACTSIMIVLLLYKTNTTWPGLLIVLSGIPVYFLWRNASRAREH